jgi:hypothetical protein
MSPAARFGAVLGAVALTATTAACGSASDGAVLARAAHFYDSLAAGDGAGACADLAPRARRALQEDEQQDCAQAILAQKIPEVSGRGEVEVFSSMAQVVHRSETLFLSRFGDRWLVVAAGCTPTSADLPHDCAIEVD